VITSSFLCEPISQNLTDSSQKSIRYRYSDSGNLLFCTLTPTAAPSVKPNAIPFIGQPNQTVKLSNSFFNPVNIEVDLVEYDVETLAYMLYGEQVKNVNDGVYTVYDFDGNIYKQYDLYEQKVSTTDSNYEIRRLRDNIDFNDSRANIIG
jgi:phenylacetate-coenzyme A ligase PaaK-like adenylate-forming protein